MTVSRLDQLYRRLLLTKFFTRGWGKPDNLKRLFAFRKILSNRATCQHLVPADYPINIDKEYKDGDCIILEGHFTSPFIHHLPGIMPKEVETASFQMILPHQWRDSRLKPVCIHLAGTGDHFFWRRRILTARPLLKEAGIASILLENPYYGTRKPKQQLRSSLHNVSDLFVMGGALVLESLALLHWCEREGWGPLGLSGISMGGHMASLAATNWTKPISLIPCLSWSTASCVFTQGVMSGAIPWKTLQEQFFENSVYQDEIRKLLISPEDKHKAYLMGQQFVKDYSQNIQQMETIHEQLKTTKNPLTSSIQKSALKTAGASSAQTAVRGSVTPICASEHSSSLQVNISEVTPLSNKRLKSNVNSENKNDLELNILTCEEYIARVHQEQPGRSEQKANRNELQSTVISPARETAESIITAAILTSPSTSSSNSAAMLSNTVSSSNSASTLTSSSASSSNSTAILSSSSVSSPNPTSALNAFSSSGTFTSALKNLSSSASPQQQNPPLHPSLSATHPSLSSSPSSTSSVDKFASLNVNRSNKFENFDKFEPSEKTINHKPLSIERPDSNSFSNLALKDALSKSRLMMSHLSTTSQSSSDDHVKDLQHEAFDFMRGVMDECTHLGNFSVPVDPELVIIVSAKQDAYVPKEGVIGLDQLWPGCEVRYLDQGHVGAVLFNQSFFRKAVSDAFDRQIKKYYQNPVSPDLKHSAESSS